MLIRFTIGNFLSFKEKESISMIPGKGSLKKHHKTEKVKGVSVLKTAAIFGANASGKSNVIRAIDFGRKMVLNGRKADQIISTDFYKLDDEYFSKPSYIEYEIQHKGKNYSYGFVYDSHHIIDEWLYEIGKNKEVRIFERSNGSDYDLTFLYRKNKRSLEIQFLDFVAMSTPINQLFLTQIRNTNVSDNVSDIDDLLNVLDWFQNALSVVYHGTKTTGSKFELFANTDLQHLFSEMLKYFDTGIDDIVFEPVDIDKLDIPNDLLSEIRDDLLNTKSEKQVAFITNTTFDKYYVIVKNSDDKLSAKLLKTKHLVTGGDFVLFDLNDESDGTRRIMDLIPFIIDFYKGENVFVIDEIERSLHPNLIRDLFDFILMTCENVNSQLIVATHEATLLTQELLRKDEIWFATKDKVGASHLHSLEDFSIRFDKQIMKDYLLGRYKGVPKLGNRSELTVLPLNQ